MRRKILFLFIAAVMFALVGFVSQQNDSRGTVYHQHRNAQVEDKSKTGLSENGELTSHLPIIIIENNGREFPGAVREDKRKLQCQYKIIDNADKMNVSSDKPTEKGYMEIAIRGNSSRRLVKKQYGIKLINSKGKSKVESLLGLPPETDFALNGSYIDKSLIRNYMLYNITSEIMHNAPKVRFCEVMLTDELGNVKYEGVYTLIEKVKVSPTRTSLNKYNPQYAETSFMLQMNEELSGYIIKHLKLNDAYIYDFKLEYPSNNEVTQKTLYYIQKEIYDLEKKIFDASNTGDWKEVRDIIDYESFAEFYLINEFFQNYDMGRNSTYMYRNLGKKYVAGPAWDFDGTFNNFINFDIEVDELKINKKFYFHYILMDPQFANLCINKYEQLRRTFLSDEYLIGYIDETTEYLGNSAIRNCDRWYNGDYKSYYDDVEKMKNYVKTRGAWMDEHFINYLNVIELEEEN